MDIRSGERIAFFVDGANLHAATRVLDFDIDFHKLRELFSEPGRLVRAFYYTAVQKNLDHLPTA